MRVAAAEATSPKPKTTESRSLGRTLTRTSREIFPRGSTKSRLGHGERARSQLLLKLAGPENMLILAVNELAVHGLAVNGALPLLPSFKKGLLYTLYTVKKCLLFTLRAFPR